MHKTETRFFEAKANVTKSKIVYNVNAAKALRPRPNAKGLR